MKVQNNTSDETEYNNISLICPVSLVTQETYAANHDILNIK